MAVWIKGNALPQGGDYEVPMSDVLYLAEHHDELLPFYDVGCETVTYTGFDDLLVNKTGI